MSLRTLLATASIILASSAFFACSNQGEGERCDRMNNNDDCQEGLVCKSSGELNGSADICCPEGSSDLPACNPGGGATSTTSTTATSTGATLPAATVATTSTGDTGGGGGAGGDSSSQGGGSSSSQGGGGSSSQGGGGAGGN